MSTFFDEYERELKIRNEEGQEGLHNLWESINAKGPVYTKIYRAYRESLDNENFWLDIHDAIPDKDVSSLISCMRENGIERFTNSYNGSGVLATSWLFIENECMLMDMVQIERQGEKIPAFLFRVE